MNQRKITKTQLGKKKPTKIAPIRIDIPNDYKGFFSYRHFTLYQYLTSAEFRKMFIDSKSNYEKTLNLFIENKLYEPEKKRILFPPTRINKNNPLLQPKQPTQQKVNVHSSEKNVSQSKTDAQKQKKFICLGGYGDVVKYMTNRGWVQNKDPKSTDFDFIWTLKTIDINYSALRKEQIAAHFSKNGAITRKSGLCKNIKNLYFKKIDPNNFFPRCYDLSDKNEHADFIEDFKTNKAISILKKVKNQLDGIKDDNAHSIYKEEVIKLALEIVQRKTNIILGEYGEINTNNAKNLIKFITEKEWAVIGEEEPNAKGDINNFINSITQAARMGLHSNEIKYPKINIRSQSELPKKLRSLNIGAPKKGSSNQVTRINVNQKVEHGTKLGDIRKYNVLISSALSHLEKRQPQYEMNGYHNIWIIKPGNLSRGRGISVSNKLSSILDSIEESTQVIVQKYIENPLIILGRKFDIRQWVLVTNLNPLTMWIWEEPYLRFGAEDYNINDISNLYSHLTNNSIAKHSEHFKETKIEGNMWEKSQFADFLVNRYGKECWTEIQNRIKKIIICSFEAARHEMKQRTNSCELFGYDVMIDLNLNVYLIEVNSSPALDYSTKITEKLVKLMLEDLIQVVIDNKDTNSQMNSIGKWTKIYQGQEVNESYLPNK